MSTNPFRRGAAAPVPAPAPAPAPTPAPAHSEHAAHSGSVHATTALTPLRAHYLKTTLVSLQLQHELSLLMQRDALAMLGPPFRGAPEYDGTELPLMRHFLRRFVLTFPFFATAPPDFFPNTVQVFMEQLLARNIIVLDEADGDTTVATTVVRRAERYLCLLLSSGIHLAPLREEVVRISDTDRERLAQLKARRRAAAGGTGHGGLEVNIVSVRTVIGKGRLRNKPHDDFVLETHTHDGQHVYVSRRYSDLARLHVALRARFPDEDIAAPPQKDRSATAVPGGAPLARERNRLTLRAYVRSLLSIHAVADSELLREFLLNDPIELSAAEAEDVAARAHADAVRAEQRQQFARETAARAGELRAHLGAFKAELLQRDGLSQLFATIRATPRVEDLPAKYRVLLEWTKTSMASGLYSMFVGRDASSQHFAQLKYMHSMMPYFMVRSIMRLSNPLAMMRSLLDLFLAQPFGQRSLLQRMFTGPVHEEIAELRELGKRVQARIGDAHLARKVDEFVAAPYRVQCVYLAQAEDERIDLLTAVLRSPLGGDLQQHQVHRVVHASRAYAAFKRERRAALARGDPEPEPDSDEAWLYEDLHVYLNLARRIHDKEQVVALIYDQATTDLLKEIITIFYAPLAQVYKAANIADTLSDVQVFINDLIRTVEEHEALSETQPRHMVQVFVDLVQRHEQMFYHFIHQVHAKGPELFDQLVRWVEQFVEYMRDPTAEAAPVGGLGLVDLAACLPRHAHERAQVFHEVDRVVHDAYERKLKRELKTQRKLARRAVATAGDEPDETMGAAHDPVAEALSEQFGFHSMFGQVADVEAEESDEESDDSAFSDSDSDEGPEDAEHFRHRGTSPQRTQQAAAAEEPTAPRLDAIRAMLPAFLKQVRVDD